MFLPLESEKLDRNGNSKLYGKKENKIIVLSRKYDRRCSSVVRPAYKEEEMDSINDSEYFLPSYILVHNSA